MPEPAPDSAARTSPARGADGAAGSPGATIRESPGACPSPPTADDPGCDAGMSMAGSGTFDDDPDVSDQLPIATTAPTTATTPTTTATPIRRHLKGPRVTATLAPASAPVTAAPPPAPPPAAVVSLAAVPLVAVAAPSRRSAAAADAEAGGSATAVDVPPGGGATVAGAAGALSGSRTFGPVLTIPVATLPSGVSSRAASSWKVGRPLGRFGSPRFSGHVVKRPPGRRRSAQEGRRRSMKDWSCSTLRHSTISSTRSA